jgi:hypothetical protein
MKIVAKIRITAVVLISFSWIMGRAGNPAWLWISVLVGLNILQSAFTGFCPAETFFKAISKSKKAASV